ncbi:MAG: hypothetical protein M3Z25_24205, partial [Actinomycetota bacterium]|nr:hypothetical protein [Actinomycetota bacterium]
MNSPVGGCPSLPSTVLSGWAGLSALFAFGPPALRTSHQTHSLEDGAFKSDHISIGSGSTLATHAFVNYGVTMGESSVLAPDSFLMKGEVIAPGDSWLGNPARPANQPAEQHDPEGNTYLGELIRRVSALEGKIDELAWTAARAGRRGRAGA